MAQPRTCDNCELEEVGLSGLLGDMLYIFVLVGNGGMEEKKAASTPVSVTGLGCVLGREGCENGRKRPTTFINPMKGCKH